MALMADPYDIPNVEGTVIGVVTNRSPYGSYRGWGQPYAVERGSWVRCRCRPTRPRAEAGQSVQATVPLPARALADWQKDGWHYEPGTYTVLVGTSVTELPLHGRVKLVDTPTS